MIERFDAIVIGAGMAGNAAAFTLASRGLSVLQLERGEYPGAKNVQGAILYANMLEKIIPDFREDAPLERHVVEQRFWFMTERAHTGMQYRSEEFNEEKPNRYTIIRSQFDRWFSKKAQEKGAILLTETTALELVQDAYGKVIGVRTDRAGGTIMAAVVVLAEGVNGLLGTRAGLRKTPKADQVAPALKDLLNGIFATDAGIENDPIDARDEGVVWYEVLGVTPEQLQPFDQVRADVEKGWRSEATRNQVAKFAQKLVGELSSGNKTLDDVAKELGSDVLPTSALKRDDITVNVLPAAVQQAFTLPKGGFGSAASGVDEGRIVFQVDEIVEPPAVDERALKQLKARIALLFSEDIIAEYFSELEQTYGVQINRQALAKLVGGGEEP